MFDLCLCRYEKGIVKEYANYQEIADKVQESGGGYVASDRSLACLWFSKNLESIKFYNQLHNCAFDGPDENIMYPVTKSEYFALLADCLEALTKKDEVAKAVDEAIGDCTVYGRSEIAGHMAFVRAADIMKHLPEKMRMDFEEIMDWHIDYLRDFWWAYWDCLTALIERLEKDAKSIDWDNEDLFFFLN